MSLILRFVDAVGEVYDDISDTFTRSASSSWGSADTGQAWTLGGDGGLTSQFSVNGSRGVIAPGATSAIRQTHLTVGVKDMVAGCDLRPGAVATGASIQQAVMARRVDADNMYQGVILFGTGATCQLQIARRVGGSSTTLATASGTLAYGSTTSIRCEITCHGDVISARAYDVASPGTVLSTAVTDTGVTAAGNAGCRAFLTSGNTNVAPQLAYDNFTVEPVVATRLNLAAAPWNPRASTRVNPPPLRYATAETLLTDGSMVTAGAYGDRTINLMLQLENGTAADLQALWRELDRPGGNWLMWQPDTATHPVFLRTRRCGPEAVDEPRGDLTLLNLAVEIPAEPAAYGLKQTIGPTAVGNDPSSGCYLDINAADLLGDVAAPAVVKVVYSDVEDLGPTYLAVRRRGTPASAPSVLQAESMTLGTDTTLPGADATMSPGSGNSYTRTSFTTTATMATRLTSAAFPTTPSVDARGRYEVFLRYRRSSATGPVNVRLGQSDGSTTVYNDEVATQLTTQRRWLSLGQVQIPLGADPIYDPAGNELAARGTVFTVQAERESGTSTLDFDALLLVPCDDGAGMVTWPTSTGPTYAVVDAAAGLVYNVGSSGEIYPREASEMAGTFPWLTPGQDTRLWVLLNAGGAASAVSDDITSSTDVTVEYLPRHLHVWAQA